MNRTRDAIIMGIGILAGIALSGPAAQAVTATVTAEPSGQPIYVDGARVGLEAYGIHGNNFVKLRDIGEAVGFNVYWDGSAVQIESDKPYTGEPSAEQTAPSKQPSASGEYTISADHWSREDFSQQANPAVFTGVYDRALYNTIRQTIVDGEVGDTPAYTMVGPWEDYSAVKHVLGRMEGVLRYEHYVPLNFPNYWQYLDYFAVSVAMPENFQAPYDFIQPVIRATAGMTDREKVTYLNDYLGTLLTYKKGKTSGVTNTFSPHTGELEAACSSYARAFSFLCAAADIPCITVSTSDHTWNLVYTDGRWLHVDAAANDLYRNHSVLLTETYPGHTDVAPEQTAFLKELLVPGSTKQPTTDEYVKVKATGRRSRRHGAPPSLFPHVRGFVATMRAGWHPYTSSPRGAALAPCAPDVTKRKLHQCLQRKEPLTNCKKDMSELIILAVLSSYSRRDMVCCVADKEAEKMRNTLEDLYYGNITPGRQQIAPNSELKRAEDRVARFKSQLTERLDEDGKTMLAKLIESQDEADSITALENFILGFRLGARLMAECMAI